MISRKVNALKNKENIHPDRLLWETSKPALATGLSKAPALFQVQPVVGAQSVPQFFASIENQLVQMRQLSQPCPNYMSRQADINEKMRAILVDWLVDVSVKYKLRPQTLFVAVDVVDRYLSVALIKRNHLQLVGISSLMLVAKYEEIYPPGIKEYVTICDNAYTREQILDCESQILNALEFNLVRPTSLEFLSLFQERLGLQESHFVFARYLLENCLLDYQALAHNKLALAAASVFLINRIYRLEMQSFHFEQVFQLSFQEIKETAKTVYNVMQRVEKEQLSALKRKFSSKHFFEVSKYRIEKIPAKAE
jgi:cyclin B